MPFDDTMDAPFYSARLSHQGDEDRDGMDKAAAGRGERNAAMKQYERQWGTATMLLERAVMIDA